MLKYRLKEANNWRPPKGSLEEAFVYLDVSSPSQESELRLEGPQLLLEEIRLNLDGSAGLRGQLIGQYLTGYDLQVVMNSWTMACFEPELIEGESLLEPELTPSKQVTLKSGLRALKQGQPSEEFLALVKISKTARKKLYTQAKTDLLVEHFHHSKSEQLADRYNPPEGWLTGQGQIQVPRPYNHFAEMALKDMGDQGELGRAARVYLRTAARKYVFPLTGPQALYQTLLDHEKSGGYIGSPKLWRKDERLDLLRYTLEWEHGFKGSNFEEEVWSMGLDETSYFLLLKRFEFFQDERPMLYSRLCQLQALAEQSEDYGAAKRRLDVIRNTMFKEVSINLDVVDQAVLSIRAGQDLELLSELSPLEWEYVVTRIEDSTPDLARFMEQMEKNRPEYHHQLAALLERVPSPT